MTERKRGRAVAAADPMATEEVAPMTLKDSNPAANGRLSSPSDPAGLEIDVAGIPKPRVRRRRGATAPRAEGRAALYLRVSTAEQADPGLNGGSLESQESRCRALCQARGLDPVRVVTDAGASGGTLERPGLSELRTIV